MLAGMWQATAFYTSPYIEYRSYNHEALFGFYKQLRGAPFDLQGGCLTRAVCRRIFSRVRKPSGFLTGISSDTFLRTQHVVETLAANWRSLDGWKRVGGPRGKAVDHSCGERD